MRSEITHSKFMKWFFRRPKSTGFLIFLFLSWTVGFTVFQLYKLNQENEQREMNTILQVVRQNIEHSLKNCYTTTLTLALIIDATGKPQNFEKIANSLLLSNPTIDAVQLSPEGILKYIYPLKGNEAALNLNLLTYSTTKKDALKSISTQKMYFAGPDKLKQGGVGIIGRFPVFKNDKFWGFSSIIIKLNKLLQSSGIENVDNSKYFFQFSKFQLDDQKEIFFLNNKTNFSDHYSVSTKIPDGDWKLYIVAKKHKYLTAEIIFPAMVGILLSALFGFLITTLLLMPKKLRSLVKVQAEKILSSEIKFRAIFDQAAVGIAHICSHTGKFIEINNQYCHLVEYSQDEMRNLNFQNITHPDDLEQDLFYFKQLKNGEIKNYVMEKRLITKLGHTIWVNLTVSPVLKSDKSFSKHIAIIEDISEKKENEKLIIKSEARFKSLFEDSPIPLWEEDFSHVKTYLTDLDLIAKPIAEVNQFLSNNPNVARNCINLVKIIDINNMSLVLYKSKTKKEITSGLYQIIDEVAISDFLKIIIAITQGIPFVNFDTKIKTTHGDYRDVDFRWSAIKGYENSLERIIISTEDITDRKNSEKTIIESKLRVQSLIDTVDGIVWECDIQTFNFNFISQKVEKILGYTPEEWLKSPNFWMDHIYEDDRKYIQNYYDIQNTGMINHNFEYRMFAKDGSIVWLRDIVNIIIEDGRPTNLRGIMIDITKNKEAEKDLNASFELVSEQNKRLLNFSYIVSHNLRSHTSNIASIVELIESSKSEHEREEMIQLLKTVSNSLTETMLHLNEVINIRTNINLSSEPLYLFQYINVVINVLCKQIHSNNVEIINKIPENCVINYNPAYLESVLYNIISNSIRYRHPSRKPVICLSLSYEDNFKILKISDNGIGIDLVKNADKIFGMYKTFTNHVDSKGIGLFITKNQIDAMGGSITVESEPDIGTTFKIFIRC
ncbi:PAS domain S-box-containing protein [Flavobacterium segetis]|uniref:histidine kinase n=1 Tax=Flavobacterium segetis TaxID=271157 RepID=A0A1M5I1F1_9FLAO|nr:PAS domain S-box protein [Flavobacterium segetis]SHG22144.1 PAS domain S-box-containing protein [Flavobacterium segetis]